MDTEAKAIQALANALAAWKYPAESGPQTMAYDVADAVAALVRAIKGGAA
jgi:hypothetical protein